MYKTKPRAPSDQAKPSEFATVQNSDEYFSCSRPESKEHKVPLALLNEVFGQFIDDCKSIMLTSNDMATARDLKTKMGLFYTGKNGEDQRRDILNRVLGHYGIPVRAGSIGASKYSTDGHIENFGHPSIISEVKSEMSGTTGGEPSLQALLYYHAFAHEYDLWKDVSNCHPCFVIFIAGESCFTSSYRNLMPE